jgi:hypothetical protein|tara:strand:- start:226 stop:456 length:231 start_codon:yes stop_codon:yes gene_type:complete
MEQETLEFLVAGGTFIGIPCLILAGVRARIYFIEKSVVNYLVSLEESISSRGVISVEPGSNIKPAEFDSRGYYQKR